MKFDKKVAMGIFIVAIMVLSTFGFILSYGSNQESIKYNNFKFVRTQLGVQTKINGERVLFNFYPTQVEDIPVDEQAQQTLQTARSLAVTYDPESPWAQSMAEIQYFLEFTVPSIKELYIERGLTNSEGYELKEIQCKDATETVPVLILTEANTTEIMFDNNCIIAQAEHVQELYRLNDRIQYLIYGVMQ